MKTHPELWFGRSGWGLTIGISQSLVLARGPTPRSTELGHTALTKPPKLSMAKGNDAHEEAVSDAC